MPEECGAQERQQLGAGTACPYGPQRMILPSREASRGSDLWPRDAGSKGVSSGGRALPGGRGMRVQVRQQCVQAQPALPACARALRANHETRGAARWQYCPSLRWQGGKIFIKQSWTDRDVPRLRIRPRDRVEGVRGIAKGA